VASSRVTLQRIALEKAPWKSKSIIDALDEQWKTVPQIRSKIVGKSGQAHDLTRALRRLSDAGHIERRAQLAPAPRRQKDRMGSARVIELFRAKLGESDRWGSAQPMPKRPAREQDGGHGKFNVAGGTCYTSGSPLRLFSRSPTIPTSTQTNPAAMRR
jgi:hypothetical protein